MAIENNPFFKRAMPQLMQQLRAQQGHGVGSAGASDFGINFNTNLPANFATALSPEQAAELGRTTGEQLFELQRARLASQGQGNQRALARMFAGRGGGASSAAASAITRQLSAERQALADASLQSQLEGRRVGIAEAQRLAQASQFNAQLRQASALAQLQARTQIDLSRLGGAQALQRQLLDQQFRRRMQKGGFLSSLGRSIGGAAVGFLTGGPPGALAGGASGFLGGSGGGTSFGDPMMGGGVNV